MSALVPLPFALPLFGAAIAIILGRWRQAQRAISLTVLTAMCAVSVALLVEADDRAYVVHRAGGWSAPLGISLVVDRFAALMLVVSSIVLLAVMVFAISQGGEERVRVAFHPVYLVLAGGVAASFVTADLFNLFVAFEMMLAASYVLITLGGRPDQVRSGMTYVVISLVASTLFITVLALLYASTGTVNMADLAERLDSVDPALRAAFALVLLVVFGIKAGLFPLFFWLPDSYPTAAGPVTAIFAGLLTKVGVYAIIRTQSLIFGVPDWMGQVLLVVSILTMAICKSRGNALRDMTGIRDLGIMPLMESPLFALPGLSRQTPGLGPPPGGQTLDALRLLVSQVRQLEGIRLQVVQLPRALVAGDQLPPSRTESPSVIMVKKQRFVFGRRSSGESRGQRVAVRGHRFPAVQDVEGRRGTDVQDGRHDVD